MSDEPTAEQFSGLLLLLMAGTFVWFVVTRIVWNIYGNPAAILFFLIGLPSFLLALSHLYGPELNTEADHA